MILTAAPPSRLHRARKRARATRWPSSPVYSGRATHLPNSGEAIRGRARRRMPRRWRRPIGDPSRRFDDPVYDEPQSSVEQAAYYDADQGAHYDAQQGAYYGEEPQASQAGYDPEYYADEAPLDPQDEAMYDDPPRARR